MPQRHLTPVLIALSVFSTLAACQRDVEIEITHQLRSTRLEETNGVFATLYQIRTIRRWTRWPCLSHGCGDSRELDKQVYELRWQLPHEPFGSMESAKTVPQVEFRKLPLAESGTSRTTLDESDRLVSGALPAWFTPASRVGSWPVREDGGVACRDSLPCFVVTADDSHMLVVDRIHELTNDEVVRDLSSDPVYGRFIDTAIELLSFQRADGSTTTPIRYALSNDLRWVVAFPYVNQCFPGEAQRRFNSVVVYDADSRHFNTYLNRETADAGLQPLLYVQYVYFAGDTAHFVARYGRRNPSPEPDHLGCVDEGLAYDFETTTGRNRPIGKGGFIAASNRSVDGTATFYTEFDFDDGVVELDVFDIPTSERSTFRLALPEEILEQVSADRVRPGTVNGEFIKR